MKLSTAAMISALSLAAVCAAAAQKMADMPGLKMPAAKTSAAKTGKAVGVIKAIDHKAGKITLQHGAIPTVGWPAMTMAFKAVPTTILKPFKVGQTVEFVVRVPSTGPEVTSIHAK